VKLATFRRPMPAASLAVAAWCALCCASSQAAETAAAPALQALAAAAAPTGLLARRRVTETDLAQQRGTGSSGLSTVSGSLSDTSANQVVTGSNQITAGALAGAAGVPVVIQNTGNNVLIQNSIVVNVQIK
jgi:hypothetical protein